MSVFEQWTPFLRGLPPQPEIKVAFPDTDRTGSTEPDDKAERFGDSHAQDHAPDEPEASDDAQLHAAIAANLEKMHADLAKLLTRWRESQPCIRGSNGKNAMDHDGFREAAMTDSTGDAGSGEGFSKRQSVAELWRRAESGAWSDEARHGLDVFIKQFLIVPYDYALAQEWARTMHAGQREGRRLETGDCWIAATAVQRQTPLLTLDRDFLNRSIPGFRVISYLEAE